MDQFPSLGMRVHTTKQKKSPFSPLYLYMIYLLTAIGQPPSGSSTVHIYTQTIQRTAQNKHYIEQHKNFGRVRAVPRLCGFYPGICLTTEEKARKNLSPCDPRNLSVIISVNSFNQLIFVIEGLSSLRGTNYFYVHWGRFFSQCPPPPPSLCRSNNAPHSSSS